MSEKLEGNILVTGTNRGIGLELVKQLAKTTGGESHLYACCREPEGERAEALRDLTTQYPGKITIIKLDIADEESVMAAVQAVSDNIGAGGLNVLINNAAINQPAAPAPLSTTGKKDMMEVYETNVAGPFLLSKSEELGHEHNSHTDVLFSSSVSVAINGTFSKEKLVLRCVFHSSIEQQRDTHLKRTWGFPLCSSFLPQSKDMQHQARTGQHCNLGSKMSCRRSAIINISSFLSSIEKCPQNFPIAQMYPYRISKTEILTVFSHGGSDLAATVSIALRTAPLQRIFSLSLHSKALILHMMQIMEQLFLCPLRPQAALNMLTRCQAEDFKRHNILVAAIHPGWVRTEMGGEQAPMTTQDSVLGILSLMSSLSNKDCGMLLDWKGNVIPW